ncbi:MAG: hypothetical protein ISP55_07250 [Flavobacteriales bacterium]|nr:hypothetical protein [Flavobacteriales bacterium]
MRTLTLLLAVVIGSNISLLFAQDCDGADHTIFAGNLYFSPENLTIEVGQTVAWINEGGFHDVNGAVSAITGDSFDNPEVFSLPAVSGNADGVCMGTFTFTVPGTYNYDCSIGSHAVSGMVGTLIVEEAVMESGCNDDLACNYDASATTDEDCIYDDGTLDLSQGIWVMASAFIDTALGCDIVPAEGLLVQMTTDASEPLSIAETSELDDYIGDLVDQGLIDATSALILSAAFDNAVFSFCGGYLYGVAGLNSIESDWDGSVWNLPLLGFTMSPAAEMPEGCPDPTASNFDPCANPVPGTCTYETGCNDPTACNYDATATGADECVFVDTPYDLSEGVLIGIPFAQYELDTTATCPVQPINDNLVQMNLMDGELASFIVDDAVIQYFEEAVSSGSVSQEDADFFLFLMQESTFSFCGDTMVGNLPVFGEVVSAWTGSHWYIPQINYYIAPLSVTPTGCSDPSAENFDVCAFGDASACVYTTNGCNDPLACNFDSTSTNSAGCNYFDTELFTIGENDFIGLVDDEDCETGYPGAYSLPVPLAQDSTGGPLYFVLFPDVESFLVENGYEIAAQDIATVSMSVCDTVMNYNSLVIGDTDLVWDGMGFTIDLYGAFIAPDSSFPVGCPDPDACNFDACSHPFLSDDCTYIELGPLETAAGDTGMVTMTELDSLTFVATPGDGLTVEWDSECGELIVDGNTATLVGPETGDCEVCVEAENADGCETESCIIVTVLGGIDSQAQARWELMPNPAASDLRVVWPGETVAFEVFDLNGRLLQTMTLQTGSQVLDVSGLQTGLYLAGPRGQAPQRLAIQR